MPDAIVTTKVRVPTTRPELVPRPRLREAQHRKDRSRRRPSANPLRSSSLANRTCHAGQLGPRLKGSAVRLQYEAPAKFRNLYRSFTFYLQICNISR
jgi:hypothetical protein